MGFDDSQIREFTKTKIYTEIYLGIDTMQFSNPHVKVAPAEAPSATASYERELSRLQFEEILRQNPGNVIVKFGATWCGPCKRIEAQVGQWFDLLTKCDKGPKGPSDPSVCETDQQTSNTLCIAVDVDNSIDLYGAFKSRRQVSGIPAILLFKKGNLSYIPDDMVVGADPRQVNDFFTSVSQ
jgi:thiol-disulfide isomerase/thioredoxin